MKKIIFVLILLYSSSLYANPLKFLWQDKQENKWAWQDTLLEGSFILLTLIDWKQTDSIITQKEHVHASGNVIDQNGTIIGTWHHDYMKYSYEEQNWILGKHPSKKKVAIYNLSVITGHALFAYIFPNPWRKMWITGGIGVEIYATSTNFVAGATIKF
jgi:hypothetical protein